MITSLGRATLLVADHDEAVEFYVETLGFEVRWDGEVEDGVRVVHVGVPGQPDVALWLLEAATDEQRALVGRQTGSQPAFVLYTDDCRGTHETLRDRGVTFHGEPVDGPGDVHVHFEDCYGNEMVLVELRADAA